jgi:hypothetical protein
VHIVAPQDGAQLFKDVDQAKGQQHLVQVVAVVEVAKQQPFQRQAKHHGQHGAAQDGQREAAKVQRQRPGQVSAQHVEAAMRQIDHAHDAEDQRQAGGQHEQQQPVLHAVEQLDEEVGEIHGDSSRATGEQQQTTHHGEQAAANAVDPLHRPAGFEQRHQARYAQRTASAR